MGSQVFPIRALFLVVAMTGSDFFVEDYPPTEWEA